MEIEVANLKKQIDSAAERIKINDLAGELHRLEQESSHTGFWENTKHAAYVMQRIAKLQARIGPWKKLITAANDLVELASLKDASLQKEIKNSLDTLATEFADLTQDLMLSGPYDDHGAIITISAGAGGTDAQDWTQMLFRMYSRYFDKRGWKYVIDEESPGEEAGLKSIVVEVDGDDFVYGKLVSEHGVHRLVRLSPYNADNLRQTSFAKVEVTPKIDSQNEVEIDDKDIKVDVYRSGGHGGQSVNTTDSAVRLTHTPTGITVSIQNERSQLQNKETAMTILRSRLARLKMEQQAQGISQIKGPNQSAEWGNQIRSYVLHPYKQVKDLRTRYETSDVDGVLAGNLDPLIKSFLEYNLSENLTDKTA